MGPVGIRMQRFDADGNHVATSGREGEGPGEGWSGANTHNKADVWYSYITLADFARVDYDYPAGGHGDNDDLVDLDPELTGRVKALVPMSLPVRISDNAQQAEPEPRRWAASPPTTAPDPRSSCTRPAAPPA